MRSLKDRLVGFFRRGDKIDVAYRQGFWCWRNVAEAMLAPFKRRFGIDPQPLPLDSWSNSALIELNRRLGFFRLHKVVNGRRLDGRGTPHFKIHPTRSAINHQPGQKFRGYVHVRRCFTLSLGIAEPSDLASKLALSPNQC